MAIKVRLKSDDSIWILLGAGFATHKSGVALCDSKGIVSWAESRDIEVIEIDGVTPAELLS